MMHVPQKTRYAIRAVFELARRHGEGPVRISEIAEKQCIPVRFLEGILNQLRQGGLLRSVRGARGGYELADSPDQISVGDAIRIIEGPIQPTPCLEEDNPEECPLYGDCVFVPLWKRAAEALSEVYDGTSFQDLIEMEAEAKRTGLTYQI